MLVGCNSSASLLRNFIFCVSVVSFDGVICATASLMQHLFECAGLCSEAECGNRGSAAELISLFPFLSVRAELKLEPPGKWRGK
jgi:hypothetical protein